MGIMIQTAFLVIAILAVQKLLGNKLHAYVRYGLWLLVVLRLLIPVNFIDSPFSMLQVAGVIRPSDVVERNTALLRADFNEQENISNGQDMSPANVLQATNTVVATGNALSVENAEHTTADRIEIGASDSLQTDHTLRTDDEARRINMKRLQIIMAEAYLSGLINRAWYAIRLIGSLLVGGFLGFSHIRFRRRLHKMRVPYQENIPGLIRSTRIPIYRAQDLETPCLVGLVRPAIYIGTDLDTNSDHFRYTITHEEVHYLHWDHIWGFVRVVLVVVYWFHPCVWLAAVLSARDGEIACDYGTVRQLGQEERFAYGEMLLNLSKIQGGKRVYSYGTMLLPHKSELKERILRLTQFDTNKVWAGILAALLMIVVAGCAFTGASEIDGDKVIQLVNEADKDSTDAIGNDSVNAVTDSGNSQDANGASDEKENVADSAVDDISEPRQLEAKPAKVSGETLLGVDGPHLDYAVGMGTDQGSRIIFHDYFGLVVYDLNNRKIIRSLDLASIGCDMTQGDDYCETAVSADGQTVWLHPISKRYMYRYEVEENLLYQEPLVKTFAVDLETKELFDRYLSLSMEPGYTDENTDWSWHSNYLYEEYKDEQGLHNAYIYLFDSLGNISDTINNKLKLCNLACVWDDMIFILFEDEADIWVHENVIDDAKDIQDDASASSDVKDVPNDTEIQDNQSDEASDADIFPYHYAGNVVDVEILYDTPCNYTRISDVFGGRRHPITGEIRMHEGIDLSAAEGTDIWAAADGVVYERGFSAKYGNYVVLLHINGDMTYYCYCQGVTVDQGDRVKRGDKIATVGQSGQATGPHLHFALSRQGAFVNPSNYMIDTIELN